MRTIRFQGQEAGKPHCMSACIAMLVGLPYSVVVTEFHETYFADSTWVHGKRSANEFVQKYLESYGFQDSGRNCYPTIEWRDGFYLLSVPSLNDPASMHAVIVEVVERDEFTRAFFVYDPQRDNPNAFHYASVVEHGLRDNNNKAKQLLLDYRAVEYYITRDTFSKGAVIDGY